jgi:hypothetical protein
MPRYRIKTSETPDMITLDYNFASIQEAKKYFCNKILGMNYNDGDGFAVSSKYFEEMGVLLSLYSKEKCYAIKSLSQSIYDLYKWGNYIGEYGSRTNKEVIGEESLLNSIHKKCNQLFNVLKLKVGESHKIFMPSICCEADQVAKSPNNFSCNKDNSDYKKMMNEIACSEEEGVCDYTGEVYTIFRSDEL